MKRLSALALVLAVGCKNGPSDEQCKQLLNHLVELEFKKAGAAASSEAMKAEIGKQKTAVSDKVSNEFLDTCAKKMSKARVECALAASDIDGDNGVSKCDEAK
jgi:hypothetical protein